MRPGSSVEPVCPDTHSGAFYYLGNLQLSPAEFSVSPRLFVGIFPDLRRLLSL